MALIGLYREFRGEVALPDRFVAQIPTDHPEERHSRESEREFK